MSLRSRFALAFAAVGAVVAVTVGALSYLAASDSVFAEVDRTLRSTTVALTRGMEKRQEQTPADQAARSARSARAPAAKVRAAGIPSARAPAAGIPAVGPPRPFPGWTCPPREVKRHRSRSCRPWAGTVRRSA